MRAVVQRVRRAAVSVDERRLGSVGLGLVVLVGVGRRDDRRDAEWLADKVAGLRLFPAGERAMECDVRQVQGAVLSISQFTLYADTLRGRRPSFSGAQAAAEARGLWEAFNQRLEGGGVTVVTGQFQADMDVELVNWGPVTLCLESPARGDLSAVRGPMDLRAP